MGLGATVPAQLLLGNRAAVVRESTAIDKHRIQFLLVGRRHELREAFRRSDADADSRVLAASCTVSQMNSFVNNCLLAKRRVRISPECRAQMDSSLGSSGNAAQNAIRASLARPRISESCGAAVRVCGRLALIDDLVAGKEISWSNEPANDFSNGARTKGACDPRCGIVNADAEFVLQPASGHFANVRPT